VILPAILTLQKITTNWLKYREQTKVSKRKMAAFFNRFWAFSARSKKFMVFNTIGLEQLRL
jgi:hypothetical protein